MFKTFIDFHFPLKKKKIKGGFSLKKIFKYLLPASTVNTSDDSTEDIKFPSFHDVVKKATFSLIQPNTRTHMLLLRDILFWACCCLYIACEYQKNPQNTIKQLATHIWQSEHFFNHKEIKPIKECLNRPDIDQRYNNAIKLVLKYIEFDAPFNINIESMNESIKSTAQTTIKHHLTVLGFHDKAKDFLQLLSKLPKQNDIYKILGAKNVLDIGPIASAQKQLVTRFLQFQCYQPQATSNMKWDYYYENHGIDIGDRKTQVTPEQSAAIQQDGKFPQWTYIASIGTPDVILISVLLTPYTKSKHYQMQHVSMNPAIVWIKTMIGGIHNISFGTMLLDAIRKVKKDNNWNPIRVNPIRNNPKWDRKIFEQYGDVFIKKFLPY